jgi:hypothetical protein
VAAVKEPALLPESWLPVASAIGEAWAQDCAQSLHAQDRGVVGAWPGTLREARSRVIANVATKLRSEALVHLDELARAAYLAARRHWQAISEPDLEP